jgi:acetyl esterase/lipase
MQRTSMTARSPRKWVARGLLLLLVALLTGYPQQPLVTVVRASPEAGVLHRDVTYCTADGVPLLMDLYTPPPLETRPAPVAVYIHGGGWQTGDKSWITRIVPPEILVGRGYVVVSVNYRLAPAYHWPAQIEDVKCAIRYLRANAARYDLDPERIGVWGESAGGHLAALVGLTDAAAGFEGHGGYGDQSSQVQAVVDISGPSDFSLIEQNPVNTLQAYLLLGHPPDAALIRAVSPVTYATKAAPPFLIYHGDQDDLVAPAHGQKLYEALQAVGAPVSLVTVRHSGHVFTPVGGAPDPSVAQVQQQIADFFDRALKPPSATAHHFPGTGKTVRGVFLREWERQGGLPQPGYPVSEAMQERAADGTIRTVQYFERAVLELRPGAADSITLRLLGTDLYHQKYPQGAPGQEAQTGPGAIFFPSTGKWLGGRFLAYWQAHDGLARQGYPISDEFTETDNAGIARWVQYFERAVFEAYPENAPPNDVLLRPLGTLAYQANDAPGGK